LSELEHPDNEVSFNHYRNNVHFEQNVNPQIPVHITSSSPSNISNNHIGQNFNVSSADNVISHDKRHGLKMKPQNFSGEEDLHDFLTQFEITSEINGWTYIEKSLYLASTLTGTARSLLTELSETERRDLSSLILKLKSRFGSENKAEVFRTQLKTRIRLKGESIPELAQSIRKLTRKAYPTANPDVVDALALDSFIDALNESDIRLRLREVSPKSISEAEQIAVRMEAHRLADRQRSRLIGSVQESTEKPISSQNSSHSNPYLPKPNMSKPRFNRP
jgi:hypothetical protein